MSDNSCKPEKKATRTVASRNQPIWHWFILGCVFVLAAFIMVFWAFAIGDISPGRRFLLIWLLPLVSGFACGFFAGSLKVSGPVGTLAIAATGGFAVWLLSYYLLVRLPTDAPQLPVPMPTPAFEIIDNATTVDLRKWQSLSDVERRQKKFAATTTTILSLRRLRPDIMFFPHRIASTALIDPEYKSDSHSVSIETVGDSEFTENMRAWWLKFDVEKEPLNDAFPLKYEITAWNGFQGVSTEWAAISVIQPTVKMTLRILVPDNKPIRNYKLLMYPRIPKAKRELFQGIKVVNQNDAKTEFEWVIDNPRVEHFYRVDWEW